MIPDVADTRPARVPWYYRPFWVLVLLFLVLGPFGLPYLWRSPAFSRPAKVVITVLLAAYLFAFVGETVHAVRKLTRDMGLLDGGF